MVKAKKTSEKDVKESLDEPKRRAKLKTWIELERYQKIGVVLLIIVLAGFFGWVWEFILAEAEGNFQHLYIKGGNLLPWINIYAYGALVVMLTTCRLTKHPWLVFLVSAISCGLLELFAGWVVFTVGHGTRYWDYTHAWFGWGNLNGFVCPVSITAFGLGALVLMYIILPWCINLAMHMSRKAFLTLAITLFMLVAVDDLTNLTLKNLDLPTAHNFYQAIGWVFSS